MRFERIESAVPPPPPGLASLVWAPEPTSAPRTDGRTDGVPRLRSHDELEQMLGERIRRDEDARGKVGLGRQLEDSQARALADERARGDVPLLDAALEVR